MELPARPGSFDFHGVYMTKNVTNNWENVQNFKARADDILIASYPKTGTTWVSYILELLHFGQTELNPAAPLNRRVPFLEFSAPTLPPGTDLAEQLHTTPRLIKTHLPLRFIPRSFWEQRCRIVYISRNAKDSAVSYFHFCRMNQAVPDPGDWSTFLQNFMDGRVMFGSWYEHVTSWWEKKQTYPNLHYMFYEDLAEDCGREIERLCSFLGLTPSAQEKQNIAALVTFDNMKQNKGINFTTSKMMNQKVSPFMRKGKVGDWKNHFTVSQNELFDEDYQQKMKSSTLHFRTGI